jgi:rubrerythrin
MEDIYTVLRHLEELEHSISRLYERFSRDFSNDREASFFFYRLSLDEIAHRDLVKYQLKLVKKSKPDEFAEVDIDIEEIKELTDNIKKEYLSKDELSIEKAVELALKIESNAAEHHYRQAMKQARPELARLLDSLGRSDKEHLAVIRDYIKTHELGI